MARDGQLLTLVIPALVQKAQERNGQYGRGGEYAQQNSLSLIKAFLATTIVKSSLLEIKINAEAPARLYFSRRQFRDLLSR